MLKFVELEALNRGHCPDCNHRGFVMGPRGGMSTNIECANLRCLARFNVVSGRVSHEFITAERIPRRNEGGAGNWGYRE